MTRTLLFRFCNTPVIEARRFPARYIHGFHLLYPEAALFKQFRDLPVEMATSANYFPGRGQRILPAAYISVRRCAMFTKDESSVLFEHPAHLFKGL